MSVINTNIQAMAAARSLNASQEMLGRSLTRLSSGSKIVNPSDDAAGLAVSEKLDAQNRRVQAATTLSVEYENLSSAISRIRDVDVAKESTQLAKYNILVQSGTSMLAQANQSPQSVLKLLQS